MPDPCPDGPEVLAEGPCGPALRSGSRLLLPVNTTLPNRVLLAVALSAAPLWAQDPFIPGVSTWTPDDPAGPAIPRAVALTAGGDLALVARSGSAARLELVGLGATGAQAPLASFALGTSTNSLAVAAGDGLDELYSLSQRPLGSPYLRVTEVRSLDALAWGAGGAAQRWQHDLPSLGNGAARLAVSLDGARVYAAQYDDLQQQVIVDALRGDTGALAWRQSRPGQTLAALAAAHDGGRVAFIDGATLVIYGAEGQLLASEGLAQSTAALALDGTGARVAYGEGAQLKVLSQGSQGYALLRTIEAQPLEVATRVKFSGDGQTLAVAWWTATTAGGVRLEVWDLANSTRLFHDQQAAQAGGLQNYPEALCLSADGRRAAFGLWGDGGTRAEVIVWDRQTNLTKSQWDLGGSAMALGMSADGRRVVAGCKSVHASQVAAGGDVRTIELSSRDLVMRQQVSAGAPMRFAARLAGAQGVILLDGQAAKPPVSLGGLTGSLLVLRQGARMLRVPCNAAGEAQGQLSLPSSLAQPGTRRHMQAIFRTPTGWRAGTTLCEPLVMP